MSQLYALIVLFTDCTRAASFRNYRASKPKLCQMSKYLTACKIAEEFGEVSESERRSVIGAQG